MPAEPFHDLLVASVDVCRRLGVTPCRVEVHCVEDVERPALALRVTPAIHGRCPAPGPVAVPASSPGDEARERGPALHQCTVDILRTLREVRRPLTKTRLFEEMARRGCDWSETTVMRYVKDLMEDGTISNPPDARPRGYRMPEWEDEPPAEGPPAQTRERAGHS